MASVKIQRPNIVLILTDQQKAASMPLYGNPVVRMPNLEQFAANAVRFTHGFTSCPLCVPARVSTFTGQYPSTHGSPDNNLLMAPGKAHLLRRLKEAGYATGLAGKNHCFRDDDLACFDSIAECGHYGPVTDDPVYAEPAAWLRQQRHVLKGCWGSLVNPYPPERLGTYWTVQKGIDFISRQHESPFFLWLSIPDPHIPFQTPEPYASMYSPTDVDMPAFREGEMDGKPRAQQIDSKVMCADAVSGETIRNVRAIYYGMNSFIDNELGRFFDALAEQGLDQNTVLFYVSDHGEYLGEHRMIRKSKSAYDCLTHIPFLLRVPGGKPGVCDEFVSLEDVMPTVLDATGLECPADVHGRSLLPIARGEPFEGRPFAYGEYGGSNDPVQTPLDEIQTCATPHSPDFRPAMKLGGFGKMRYLRTRDWKLVAYVNDTYELYDLQNDPHELTNLAKDSAHRDVRLRMEGLLIEHMMRISAPGVVTESVS